MKSFQLFLGINKNYETFSKAIEKGVEANFEPTLVELEKLTRVQRVTTKRNGNEVLITLRTMDGTTKVTIPVSDRKIKLRDFVKAVAESGELHKNTAKAMSCRKIVCDILR